MTMIGPAERPSPGDEDDATMQYQPAILRITRRDTRFPYEAYEFVEAALQRTQRSLGRQVQRHEDAGPDNHVTGPELVAGACDLAKEEFGMLAPTVFRQWNVKKTDDIGDIVFNLIDAGVLFPHDGDSRDDFHGLFDLERALAGETPKLAAPAHSVRGGR